MNKKQKKVAILISFIVLIFVILISVYRFIGRGISDINAQNMQYLTEISRKNAGIIENTIKKDLDALSGVANILGGSTSIADTAVEILKMENERTAFKRMGFIFPNGQAITTDGYDLDLSDREYFKKAMKGESSVSDKFQDVVDGKYINVYAVSVYNGREIVGVLFATTNTSQYSKLLDTDTFSGEGFSYIIKSDGTSVVYIKHKNNVIEFENIFNMISDTGVESEKIEEMKHTMSAGRDGIMEYSREGMPCIAAYSKTKINDWYVVSVVPVKAISQNTDRLLSRNIIAVVIVLLMFIFLLFLAIFSNKKNRIALEKIAFTDDVTGYPNWKKFVIDAENALDGSGETRFAIIALDIDNFKAFNDVYGYNRGTGLLINIAQCMEKSLSKGDFFARISADNFVIFCKIETDILSLPQKIVAIQKSSSRLEKEGNVVLSCGIYEVIDKNMSISAMYDRAIMAKSTVKYNTETVCAIFDEKLRESMLLETKIENEMEQALIDNNFLVYYQPKYDPVTEIIMGAEALVRWSDPVRGIVPPGEFIPVFERNGFIKKLDIYVFEKVCGFIVHCLDMGVVTPMVPISVNLSRNHLIDDSFINKLIEITEKYSVSKSYIEIEITESAIMGFTDDKLLIDIVNKIKSAGFSVSMDDFGSGYSSLNMLSDLPLDIIKMDRRFFLSSSYKKIVGGVIAMIKILNMKVVAEGIEDKEQVDELIRCGCDLIQGFYFSRPIPEREFIDLLKTPRKINSLTEKKNE